VLVVLQWTAAFGIGFVAPGTLAQFFGMFAGPILGLALLLLWWVFFSRAPWTDRLWGLGWVVGSLLFAFALAHPTVPQALIVFGIPVLSLSSVIWLLFSRRADPRTRRLGAVAVVLITVPGWTLLRTDGVDGTMSIDYAWRWSETAEERLLATQTAADSPGPVRMDQAWEVGEAAWPGFRGKHRDNLVAGSTIETGWDSAPPEEIWRRPIGPGWSSFAVVGDRLYTQEQRGEDELVACYDAGNGQPVWFHRDRARFWEALAGAGPRATPTYDAGRIYALGATGILNCLDAATGELLWSRRLTDDTGAEVPDWGFAGSPLLIDDLVIVHAGGPDGKAVVAYDRLSGEPRWFAPAGTVSYSSPHLAMIDGVAQVLILTGDGATSIDPLNGTVLWEYSWPLAGGARIVQPWIGDDGQVLIGTGFGKGVRSLMVALDRGSWQITEGWTSRGLKPYFNDFVVHRGHLFGFDGSILAAIDARTGERRWKKGRYGNGQVLLLAEQDLLLVLSESGELVLVNADPARFEELSRMPAIHGKTWNHPVIVDDRLYVRNGEEAACFRLTQVRSP
jgi:outer membrane protein assembly factor BamB